MAEYSKDSSGSPRAEAAGERLFQMVIREAETDYERSLRFGYVIGVALVAGKALKLPTPHDGRGNLRAPHPTSQRKETP